VKLFGKDGILPLGCVRLPLQRLSVAGLQRKREHTADAARMSAEKLCK